MKKNSTIDACPFCGESFKGEKDNETGQFHCPACDRLFDDEDIEREDLRHRISAILSGKKNNKTDLRLIIEETVPATDGCTSVEVYIIEWCNEFQDGTIWLHFLTDDAEGDYLNIDDISIENLKRVLEGLE